MEKLRNRHVAAGIMVLMILLSLPLGAWRTGSRLYGAVEDLFYNGEAGNGIGVASDISQRAEAAVNMIIIAKRNMDPNDPCITGLEAVVMEVNMAKSLQARHQADVEMGGCMAALYDALGEAPLSEKDARYRESLYADFTSAAMTMSHDPYNAQAVEYNRALSAFPGGLLMRLFGYEEAPVFR